MLMACLSTRPHITFDLDDSLIGADEYSLELLQALGNGLFGFTSDKNTAMDRLFEGWFPSWVRFRPGDDAWVTKALLREGGRRIGKLACGEKRILKIIGNPELE
jgi:hypothetical protein